MAPASFVCALIRPDSTPVVRAFQPSRRRNARAAAYAAALGCLSPDALGALNRRRLDLPLLRSLGRRAVVVVLLVHPFRAAPDQHQERLDDSRIKLRPGVPGAGPAQPG